MGYASAAMTRFYLTSAIQYVNDEPHIGHMYENIVADLIARHRRRMGDDVRFLTGRDEHGQKIERAAAKKGVTPIELAQPGGERPIPMCRWRVASSAPSPLDDAMCPAI